MLVTARRPGRVSEAIVRRIKEQITEGRIEAGHKLPAEREMARRFKTSRASVREAYRSREDLGLLRIRPSAGAGVFAVNVEPKPGLQSLSSDPGLAHT